MAKRGVGRPKPEPMTPAKEIEQKVQFDKLNKKIMEQMAEIVTLKKTIEELMEDKERLNQEIVNLKVRASTMIMEKDLKKAILKEYAQNKGLQSIFRELTKTYVISIEEIKDVIDNLNALDSELAEYYKTQVEYFKENDLAKFISEKDLTKSTVNETLDVMAKHISNFQKIENLSDDDLSRLERLLKIQEKYLKLSLETTGTYKEENNIANLCYPK